MAQLTGIGIPYYDRIIPVPEAVITQHQLPKGHTGTLAAEICEELAARYGCTAMMGGPAANTLAGFAALGGKAAHYGVLADDEAGRATLANLSARGIAHLHHSQRTNLASPIIYALVTPDGERTFITFKNSAEDILPNEVPADLASNSACLFTQIRFIIRGGLLPLFAPHFVATRAAGNPLAISLQAFSDGDHYAELIRDFVAQHATVVFANEHEIMQFSRTTTLEAALAPLNQTSALYVITRGAAGVLLHQHGTSTAFTTTPLTTIVDAIGAGDQFAAGFLFGLLHNWPLPACVALAQSCAREILQTLGGQPPLGTNWQHLVAAAKP